MRVLVTGASGYIGGRLVQALAADPAFAVTAGGRAPRTLVAGVANAVIDWSPDSLMAACRNQDVVVHLAAMNEADCERHPEDALRCNGLYTENLLRAAESCQVRRVIYISTSKVFGANPTGTIDETTLPRPTSHYAITHRLAEDYVLAAHKTARLQGVVLRLSNALGAPADLGVAAWMLIANDFCRQAATLSRIVLAGSGMAWRNFIAMSNVVTAIRHMATVPAAVIGDGLFHLGGPHSVRIYDLATLVAARAEALFGRPVEISRPAPLIGDEPTPLDWQTAKLVNSGWATTECLDEEIDATMRLCRETKLASA